MASLEDYLTLLANQVGKDHAGVLLDHGSLMELAQGAVLMQDQEPITAMYLLLSGQVGLSVEVAGHAIHLGELESGNWIGEVAYFSHSLSACSTVKAVTDCQLMRLGFAEFSAMIRTEPEAACQLTHVLVTMLIHRLRATAQNPVLDTDGQLLLLGNLSLPNHDHDSHEHRIRDFFRNLLGMH